VRGPLVEWGMLAARSLRCIPTGGTEHCELLQPQGATAKSGDAAESRSLGATATAHFHPIRSTPNDGSLPPQY